jgi:hypothetical protein
MLGFDQDLIERMDDFRGAYLNAKEGTVLAEAFRMFIKDQIGKNVDIRRRYAAARRRRGKPL